MSHPSLATHLSGDVLAEVANWLPSDALGALVLCCNTLLNRKLANHVRTVKHYSTTRHLTWPFYIRHWKALKHLSIHPTQSSLDPNNDKEARSFTMRAFNTSLPSSLESFHISYSPSVMREIVRRIWFANTTSSPPPIDYLHHMSGGLAVLLRLRLPNLRDFSFTSFGDVVTQHDASLSVWLGHASSLPLTHLSLSNMTLSKWDGSLCEIFYSLPRTLTSLNLRINNDHHTTTYCTNHFNTHTSSSTFSSADDAYFEDALPPQLTRLQLCLTTVSHMPASTLARLSNLTMLKLKVKKQSSIRQSSQEIHDTRVLLHLPSSVTNLSLSGFNTNDLQTYLSSIPDNHRNLTHFTVKHVVFPPGSCNPYPFLTTITSYAQFRQLEALHIFINVNTRPLFNTPSNDHVPYEGMNAMMRLRSLSNIFLWPCFNAFWKCIATVLTADDPMRIYNDKTYTLFDEHWIQEHFQSSKTPIHLIINGLVLNRSLFQKLKSLDCCDNKSYTLSNMFKSVKRVAFGTSDLTLSALQRYPGHLESVLDMHSPVDENIFHPLPDCMQYLRVLNLSQPVYTEHFSSWLRLMPKTLETLDIDSLIIRRERAINGDETRVVNHDPSDHILTYLPPRLQHMDVNGGFAIGVETFDAMPTSLRTIKWMNIMDVRCSASNMCRWPRHMQCIQVSTYLGPHALPECEQSPLVFDRWWQTSPHLNSVWFVYHVVIDGHNINCVVFKRGDIIV